MSSGQLPRTPEFFPHMKDRGRGKFLRGMEEALAAHDAWEAKYGPWEPWVVVPPPETELDKAIREYGGLRWVPFQVLVKLVGLEDEALIIRRRPQDNSAPALGMTAGPIIRDECSRLHDLDDVAAEFGIDLDEPGEQAA